MKFRRRPIRFWMILCCLIWPLTSILQVRAVVTSADLARRFGVVESQLTSSSKQAWKVECSETSEDFFERFRDYDEIAQFVTNDLKKKLGGSILVLGKSHEKRDILALSTGSKSKSAPIILAMAGLHGREWTSIAAALYAMNSLLRDEIKDVNIVFVPIINPDGYVKTFDGGTHTKERYKQGVGIETDLDQPNRYWRKNGAGVDLNRNFGANFYNDTKKSSKLRQSDVYPGPKPFSEPETRALHDFAMQHIDRIQAVIDFHCCIGAVLGPPILPSVSRESQADNERVGQKLVEALSEGGKGVTRTVKGGDGSPGAYEWRARDRKDLGAGLSSSWGFLDLVVDLTFVVEMRGKFVAPCFEIKQLGKEALFAMRALIKEVESRPVLSHEERKRVRLVKNSNGNGYSADAMHLSNLYMLVILACLIVVFYLAGGKRYLSVLTNSRRNQ